MELDYFDTIYSVLFPIMFGIMAIFFLGIGLRAILMKRPFLVSNRWMLLMMFVIFIPMILRLFLRPPSDLMQLGTPSSIWGYPSDDVVSTEGLRCIRRYRHLVS